MRKLIGRFNEDATVSSIRALGVALEQIAGQSWGFAKAAPWNYQACVDRAIGWFKQQGGTLTPEE